MFMMSVTNLMYYVFKSLKSFDIVSVINVLTSRAKPKKQIMSSEKGLILLNLYFVSQRLYIFKSNYDLYWTILFTFLGFNNAQDIQFFYSQLLLKPIFLSSVSHCMQTEVSPM